MNEKKRHWSDQPKILDDTEVLCHIFVNGRGIEVRRVGLQWYLTTGTLFGSQTIVSSTPDPIFRAIGAIDKARDVEMKLPKGCSLVANADEDAVVVEVAPQAVMDEEDGVD